CDGAEADQRRQHHNGEQHHEQCRKNMRAPQQTARRPEYFAGRCGGGHTCYFTPVAPAKAGTHTRQSQCWCLWVPARARCARLAGTTQTQVSAQLSNPTLSTRLAAAFLFCAILSIGMGSGLSLP